MPCDFLQKGNVFGKSYQQWDYHAFPFNGRPQIQTWGANLQGGWSRGLPLCSASRNCSGDCTWPKGWPNHPSQRLNFRRRCSYGEWATRVHNGCGPKWTSLYNRYVSYYLFFQPLGWVGFFHHDSFIDKTKAKQRAYRGGGEINLHSDVWCKSPSGNVAMYTAGKGHACIPQLHNCVMREMVWFCFLVGRGRAVLSG